MNMNNGYIDLKYIHTIHNKKALKSIHRKIKFKVKKI